MKLSRVAAWLLCAAIAPAHAQMCKIPPTGNPNNCSSDSASQSSPNASTGVGNPIDLTSGNKYQEETDIAFPGELSIGFRRHYNSLQSHAGPLGAGWSGTYDTRLGRTEFLGGPAAKPTPPQITVTQGDGRIVHFEPVDNTATLRRYRSIPSGYGLIEEDIGAIGRLRSARGQSLSVAAQQAPVWRWIWPSGRTLVFDGRGLLQSIADVDGSALRLQFDLQQRFSKVSDGQGNWLAAAYWDDPTERLSQFGAVSQADAHGAPPGTGFRGRLKTLSLSSGEVLSYGYDSQGNLSDVRYPDGTRRRYEYVRVGDRALLSKIFSPDGRLFASYGYDERGHAISSTHPDHRDDVKLTYEWPTPKDHIGHTEVETVGGVKTRYTWRADPNNESPQILEARGPGCRTCAASNVRYEYDAKQRETTATQLDADGAPVERRSIVTDELGRTRATELARYADGRVQPAYWRETREYAGKHLRPSLISQPSVVPGQLHTLEIEYNAYDQPVRIVEHGFRYLDPQGAMPVSLDYTSTAPLERVTVLEYQQVHGASVLKSVDGPLPGTSDTWSFGYDAAGRVQNIQYPMHLTETFEHDGWGRITAHTGLDGVRESLSYDAKSQIVALQRGDLWLHLQYDEAGRVKTVLNSLGAQMTLTRDAAGQLTEIGDPAGNRIRWSYDTHGAAQDMTLLNPDGSVSQRREQRGELQVEPGPDAPNHSMLAVVATGLPAETRNALAVLQVDKSTGAPGMRSDSDVDPALIPASYRGAFDSQARRTSYVYDDFGRMTAQRSPVSGLTHYRWDNADNLIESSFSDGSVTHITRDALGRPIRVQAGSEDGRIEWGAANRPTRITYAAGEERFEYDRNAELAAHTLLIDGKSFRLSYEFDALGRIARKHLPDGSTLKYVYNGFTSPKPGVLAAIFKEGAIERPVITGLNEASELYADQGFNFGNGLSQRRILNVDGEVISVGNLKVGESHLDWSRHDSPASYSHTTSAGEVATPDVMPSAKDRLAARLTEWGGQVGALPAQALPDMAAMETQASYDSRGQLVADAGLRYEWDALGRLVRVRRGNDSGFIRASFTTQASDQSRTVAEYRYNLLGERVAKVVYTPQGLKTTYFFWDGTELAADIDANGGTVRDYVYLAGRPVALLTGHSIYAIHTDHRMAPIAVTDAERRVVWQAALNDNGAAKVFGGSTLDLPLRGSNQYFDAETGLHYNLARYMNPHQGRYLSPDPVGLAAGPDLYQFALGSPHTFIDPLGLQTIPANGDVTSLSFTQRFEYVLKKSLPLVPKELVGIIQGMLQPKSLEIAAGVLALYGVAQFTPVGWVSDLAAGAAAGIGWFFIGDAVGQIAHLMVDTYQLTSNAKCVSDLDAAARKFADITAAAVLALGTAGAAKLSSVLGDVFKVKASGFWDMEPKARGVAIEQSLGHNVPPSYPVIDIWDANAKLGTSIKSIDLTAKSYANPSSLGSKVMGYVNDLKNFKGKVQSGLDTTGIQSKEFELVIQSPGTPAQMQALQQVANYAASNNIAFKIVVLP